MTVADFFKRKKQTYFRGGGLSSAVRKQLHALGKKRHNLIMSSGVFSACLAAKQWKWTGFHRRISSSALSSCLPDSTTRFPTLGCAPIIVAVTDTQPSQRRRFDLGPWIYFKGVCQWNSVLIYFLWAERNFWEIHTINFSKLFATSSIVENPLIAKRTVLGKKLEINGVCLLLMLCASWLLVNF